MEQIGYLIGSARSVRQGDTIRMMKIVAFALAAALVIAGCGPAKTEEGGTTTGTSTPKEGATKIVFIPKNTGNPYFNRLAVGFEESAKSMNLDFSTQAPAEGDATSQLPIIKDQVQRGVNVIAISVNSPDALNEALDQAKAKGVAIITVDADLTGNEMHRDVGILSTDFSGIGPAQVELMGSMIGYEGEIAILSATVDAPNQNAWIEGMKATLKDPKFAKMKLVEIVYGDDKAEKSSTEMEALLSKHPNLRGVISPTSVGLAAAAQVLENSAMFPGGAKATGKGIVLTGLSTPNQMKEFVTKGVVQKFQLWDPADLGKIAAFVGSQMHGGKFHAKEGDEIEVPGHGKVKIGPKNVIYAGPLLTFDKDNISKYDF